MLGSLRNGPASGCRTSRSGRRQPAEPTAARFLGATWQMPPAAGFPGGVSPFGALQMLGNVWEFVEDSSAPPGTVRMRGGSFQETWEQLGANVIWDYTTVPADFKKGNIGFRCVRDAR